MKILIWFGCILVSAIIQTMLEMTIGISSPLLQFLATCAVARHFCKKWDEKRSSRKVDEINETVVAESHNEETSLDTAECIQLEDNSTQPSEKSVITPSNDSEEKRLVESPSFMNASNITNPFDALKKLNELHNEGILTDEEYSEKKKEILNRI